MIVEQDAFSGPWLLHFRQGTDFRKAILRKHSNISSGIKCFVEDASLSDCIERFLIKTGADMRFRLPIKNRRGNLWIVIVSHKSQRINCRIALSRHSSNPSMIMRSGCSGRGDKYWNASSIWACSCTSIDLWAFEMPRLVSMRTSKWLALPDSVCCQIQASSIQRYSTLVSVGS
jgi:hypothetical protein